MAGDLVARWVADDLNSVVASGGQVTEWSDSVRDIRAAASGSPVLIQGSLGGRSSVRFDSSNGADGFRVRSADNPVVGLGDFSVVVAFQTDSQTLEGGQTAWYRNTGLVDSSALGLSQDWGLTINAAGRISAGLGAGFEMPSKTVYSTAAGLNDGQLHVVVFSRSGPQLTLYVDDLPSDWVDGASDAARSPLDLVFGMLTTGKGPFTGDMGQIRIYDGALSAVEAAVVRADVKGYYNNRAPQASDDVYAVSEDTPFASDAGNGVLRNDNDPDGDWPLTAVLVNGAEHGTVLLNADGSFTYTPAADYFGADSFTYTANDFRPGNVATVTLNVGPAYDPAAAVADRYEVLPGQSAEIPVLAGVLVNDLNPDLVPLQAVLEQNVAHGALTLRSDGSFRYDPGAFFGTTSFTYRVQDGTATSAPATVTLIVNSAPVATDDSYALNEDEVLVAEAARGLLANDLDAEGNPLTLTLTSQPQHGQLQVQPDGSFRYAPAADYFGDDQFTYVLSDGLLQSSTATVRFGVNAVNDRPEATADVYVSLLNQTLQIAVADGVLSNDTDVDGPTLTAVLVTAPQRGTLQLEPDGSFVYQPQAGFVGRDLFTYRASDSLVQSDLVSVSLIVQDQAVRETDPTGDSIVTFNEIMYNPVGATDERLEWLELHNQMAINMDISGWRLSRGVSYEFAEGTVIPGGGYLVIAVNPQALAEATGFTAALGPFVGALDNGGEEIELRNNSGRVMDILDYDDRDPWPVGPDSTGATLAKRGVHLATEEAGNWTTSAQLGGTPGAANFPDGAASNAAWPLLNEISAAGTVPFRVELANPSGQAIDLQGYVLYSSDSETRRYEFPQQILPAGGFLALNLTELGIRAGNEDRLILLAPGSQRVVDAQEVVTPLRGRLPQHDQRWLLPSQPTFGQANAFQLDDRIVINELMYHAPGFYSPQLDQLFENPEEWVELYNRSQTDTVDLSGWRFTQGIDYAIPAGTLLGPNAYLVISNDPETLLRMRPGLLPAQVLGPFSRQLANGGETVELSDAFGNPADTVRYYDGGRWASEADASAASLELRDPYSDNSVAESWAASDESARSVWQTITYSGVGRNNSGDPTQYNELVLGLHDDGEVLIDDIRVIEKPGTPEARQLIQNGTFESDSLASEAAKWRIIGNHHGTVVADPDDPENQVLRLVANGPTEHMHNHAETTLKFGDTYVRLNNSTTYEISYRVRWISGSNQFNSRLYFNRLPLTTRLARPLNVGTPGQINSRYEVNTGPTYEGLIHAPAVPDASQAVTVSVAAADPQGVQQMTLWYAVNSGAFASLPMSLGADGRYQAVVPPQASSSLVQFYVEGRDGQGASSMFPADGPASRALYRVQDGRGNNDSRHTVRILMTAEDTNKLHELTNVMSNNRLGATVIYREQEIFYDVGIRLKGSERGRFQDVRVGFNIQFDPTQLFRGVHETIGVDRSGSGDEYSQEEIIVRQVIAHAGDLPQIYDDLIHVVAPKTRHDGSAMLNTARYNDIFLDSQYENGSQGTGFEYELIYYPTTTTGGPEGLKRPSPDNVVGVAMRDQGDDKELYRWHWIIKNNRKEDDYSQLMLALKTLGQSQNTPGFHSQVQQRLDVDQWLRSFAVQTLCGIGDNYVSGAQHNAIFYVRPEDDRLLYLPWDLDFSFTQGATDGLLLSGDLQKLVSDPGNNHTYYGHVYDIIQTTFNRTYMDPWIDHFDQLVPGQPFFQGFKSYIGTRGTTSIRNIERAVPKVPFDITTTGPLDVGDSPSATLQGTGWVDVRQIRMAGQNFPLPITWLKNNQWQVQVPVGAGTQEVTLEAFDFQGQRVASDTITITSTAATPVRDYLRISEIHYHPAEPRGDELELDKNEFEFIELVNRGPVPLDLTAVYFVYVDRQGELEGVDFTFDQQTLQPGARLVVPGNRDAFLSRYGAGVPLASGSSNQDTPGSFTGRLNNGGETLTLLDATNSIVQQFTYDDAWYRVTDGDGYSLEIIDTQQNDLTAWNRQGAWQASSLTDGTPGIAPYFPGDANLDRVFDSNDIVLVFQAGEYEDHINGNSVWAEGDWNHDGDFTSDDIVLAFQRGNYDADAPIAATAASSPRIAYADLWQSLPTDRPRSTAAPHKTRRAESFDAARSHTSRLQPLVCEAVDLLLNRVSQSWEPASGFFSEHDGLDTFKLRTEKESLPSLRLS